MREKLIDSYEKSNRDYFANSNSLHELGLNSRKLEEAATKQILEVLNLKDYEVIYTSGNAESYSLIISNIKVNESITSNSDEFMNIAKEMNRTIDNENSVKRYRHIDISNNYNLENVNDLSVYDYITIEDEIPFLGVLLKRKNKKLVPIIHGGKSTTKYRSGTAPTPLIVTISKLIKEKYKN